MGTRRVRPRIAALALAGVLLGVGVGMLVKHYVLDAEWWQADHATTASLPASLADVGPPPGPLVAAWQVASELPSNRAGSFGGVAFGLVDNQLVIASTQGVDVRDAASGQPRWHYFRSGWSLAGWAATDRELLVYFERAQDRGSHVLIGFDAVTGQELWRSTTVSPATVDSVTLRWPAGAGIVLTAEHGLSGRASATGRLRWSRSLPKGCQAPTGGEHAAGGVEDLAVLTLDCGTGATVLAVDPATGRTRWERRTEPDPDVVVQAGDTEIWDGTVLTVLDDQGRPLVSRSGTVTCRDVCPMTVAAGRVVIAYEEAGATGAGAVLEAVDATSGTTMWRRGTGGVDQLVAAGGRVYAVEAQLADPLLPAAVEVVEPVSGQATRVPLPFTYRRGDQETQPWLAGAGGLLYAAYPVAALGDAGGAQLVALRGVGSRSGLTAGPAVLGGVPPRDWPDACRLVTREDLAAAFPGVSYQPRPVRLVLDDVTLPHPVTCEYQPSLPGMETITVSVRWVATSSQAASSLLASLRDASPGSKELSDVAEEAYDLGALSSEVDLRVGRMIVGVSAGREGGGTATRVARIAAWRAGMLR